MTANPPRRKGRTVIRIASWLLTGSAALLALAFLAFHLLPVDAYLADEGRKWLKQQGIEADFRIARLSGQEIELRDLRLLPDGAVQAESVTVTYALNGIRQGHVRDIAIEGLVLKATQTPGGSWTLAGLEPFLTAPQAETAAGGITLPARLPFDALTITDALLTATTRDGTAYEARATLALRGDYTGDIALHSVSLPLNDAESIDMGNITLKRDAADAPLAFAIEHVAHITAGKAWFMPVSATGEITLARDNHEIAGIIHITDLRGLWQLDVNARAALDKGTWNIAFEQPPMQFETGILQPDMLFPVLRGAVSQVTGSISLKGEARKDAADAEITTRGEIRLTNAGGTVMDVPVSALSGTVKLASLWPPATEGQQRLSIGEIILGLPLSDGAIAFTLREDGRVDFAPSRWRWAGGELHTGGARMNLYDGRLPDITLSAKGLELEQLLADLLQKGVSATGRLDGSIPVSFTADGDAMITNGRLSTEGGGIIRYLPDAESPLQMGHSFQTDLLLQAVNNFHYDALSMTINSKDAHELSLLLHVRGRNPELYDGQTIELNINLTGNLLDIVQSGMNIYTLPERLQEQLMQ